jgi:hypothetical protein
VNGFSLAREHKGKMLIPSIAYEQVVFQYLPTCFQVLKEIGASAPVVIALTLTNTRGLWMGMDFFEFDQGYQIEADTLVLPETVIEDFSTPPGKILKPLFDLVWNACGFPSSRNRDTEGNWVNRR